MFSKCPKQRKPKKNEVEENPHFLLFFSFFPFFFACGMASQLLCSIGRSGGGTIFFLFFHCFFLLSPPFFLVEWLAGCFAVLAGAAVAPLGHNDISTKIYIMKLPATALTQNFSTTTKMCFLQHQNHFPTRFLCESSSIQLYVGRFVTF